MNKVLAVLFLGLTLSSAHGALLQRDYVVAGDGDITFDSWSNLEWLDLDGNFGRTPNSALSISIGGFRPATVDELMGLLNNATLPTLSYGVQERFGTLDEPDLAGIAALDSLLHLLGMEDGRPGFNCLTGYIQNATQRFDVFDACVISSNNGYQSAFMDLYSFSLDGAIGYTDGSPVGVPNPNISSYFVRSASSIPEPATFALVAVALLGLTAGNRRKSKTVTC